MWVLKRIDCEILHRLKRELKHSLYDLEGKLEKFGQYLLAVGLGLIVLDIMIVT